jgi:sister chromatid cohesion protein DCC1
VSSLKESNLLCRGEEEESVVLCTSTHTFDVKEAETSNSLLLLPDLSFPEHMPEVRIY